MTHSVTPVSPVNSGPWTVLRAAVARLEPARALVLGLLVIALTLSMGLFSRFALSFGDFWYHFLDMDGERSLPALVSGGFLLTAGLLALLVAPPSPLYRLFGAGLAFCAFDEVFAIHEHLQRFTGVNWIKLYLPIFAACLVVAVLLLRRLRTDAPRALPLLVAGAACWSAAQAFEWLEWGGTDVARPGYLPMMFAEETLEDLGSLLFLIAVLVIGRASSRAGAGSSDVA